MAKRRKKRRKQKGGWLSRYDFAYAGRDSVNQAAHHCLTLDAVASRRINQLTRNTAEEIKRIAPGLIRGAIEEAYKTPFRLLGKFGTNKYNQLKKKKFITNYILDTERRKS